MVLVVTQHQSSRGRRHFPKRSYRFAPTLNLGCEALRLPGGGDEQFRAQRRAYQAIRDNGIRVHPHGSVPRARSRSGLLPATAPANTLHKITTGSLPCSRASHCSRHPAVSRPLPPIRAASWATRSRGNPPSSSRPAIPSQPREMLLTGIYEHHHGSHATRNH